MNSVYRSVRANLVSTLWTLAISLALAGLHMLCQYLRHRYCQSNLFLYILLDESRMCRMLASVSSTLESNAIGKFSGVVSYINQIYVQASR